MTVPKSIDRAISVALAAPLCIALYFHGSAKQAGATVDYPRTESGRIYLADNGSYVTNDYVHINFTRQIVPDTASVFVDRREVTSTNAADWATFVASTFAEFAVPTNLPCANATNWNWIVYTDWTPEPTVLTNGVLHVNWGTPLDETALTNSHLAVGIPVQTSVWLNGELIGTPGGTNSLANAAIVSETADAETETETEVVK